MSFDNDDSSEGECGREAIRRVFDGARLEDLRVPANHFHTGGIDDRAIGKILHDARHSGSLHYAVCVRRCGADWPGTGAELIERYIFRTGQRSLLVSTDGTLEGLVTLHQVKGVPQKGRKTIRVRDAMTPATELRVVDPQTSIPQGLELMEGQDINQVPVTRGGRLLSCVTRDHVLRMLHTKMELETATAKSTDAIGTS